MQSPLSRRHFIRNTSVATAASTLGFPAFVSAKSPNSKLQCAFVAVGGRAKAHISNAKRLGLQCVAFAEVDKSRWSGIGQEDGWKDAKGYTDWREIFNNHEKEVDVIFVATPDHTHYAPSMTAISKGIHCYTEKPLSWSVKEALNLEAAYHKNTSVVTQMGNQGHAEQGWRIAYEYIKQGAIGHVKEFHTWTNRPVWPQGNPRPTYSDPVPENLDWESWIGCAEMRPFVGKYREGPYKGKPVYHPFSWRGVVDFGAGALGDMACHTTDGIYAIMNPGYAKSVEPVWQSAPTGDQYPAGMIVKAEYRGNSERPGFTTFWYEGKRNDGSAVMPECPEELNPYGSKDADKDPEKMTMPRTGNLIIGTHGKMLVTGDYWNSPRLLPLKKGQEFGKPLQILERSPGHHDEFIMACRGEKPREFSRSNFGYAGPMTANIQLGNLCARAGKKLELNEQGVITNDPKINDLAWRKPRGDWGAMETNI